MLLIRIVTPVMCALNTCVMVAEFIFQKTMTILSRFSSHKLHFCGSRRRSSEAFSPHITLLQLPIMLLKNTGHFKYIVNFLLHVSIVYKSEKYCLSSQKCRLNKFV